MTTTELHRHLATGPKSFMLTRNGVAQVRLTYRQARWLAKLDGGVVERMAGSKRMEAMAVQA